MKKSLFFLLFALIFATNSQAKIVNSLALIVNNEPITQYEIKQRMKEAGFDEYSAINSLVDERLKDAHLKQLNIQVTNYDVDKKIQELAKERGISVNALYQAMEKKGISRANYKKLIENQLKEEKLFTSLAMQSDQEITQEDIENFYEEHLDLFSHFKNIKVLRIYAPKAKILEDLMEGKPARDFTQEEMNLSSKGLDPRMNYLFLHTPENALTPIMPTDKGYVMFYVIKKTGQVTVPLEEIYSQVANSYAQKKRDEAFKTFFAKLRTKANIQFIQN